VFNKWLTTTKLTAGDTPAVVPTLPGFWDEDLTAMKTGKWDTTACYLTADAATAGTGIAGCSKEYTLLRALWDSTEFTGTILGDRGLTAATIPDLLFAYESDADSKIWDSLAGYFVTDKKFADDVFDLSDLEGVFCTDGVPETAENVVKNAGSFKSGGLPIDELFFNDFFLAEVDGWDSDENKFTADDDLTKYNWLTAICPGAGDGAAAIVDLWGKLLEDLVAFGEEGMFPLIVDCNPEFVEGTPSTTMTHMKFDVACPACPVAGADGKIV